MPRPGSSSASPEAVQACPACGSADLVVAKPPLATRVVAWVTLSFPVGKAFHARPTCKACGWTGQAVA